MAGFTIAGRLSGGAPTIITMKAKDTETLSFGDIANVETGEIDLGATADTQLVGPIVSATVAAVDSTTNIQVCVDPDVILQTADANARLAGATLDLSGATGAQTLAASSNKEFIVLHAKSATMETQVLFNVGHHLFNKAQ